MRIYPDQQPTSPETTPLFAVDAYYSALEQNAPLSVPRIQKLAAAIDICATTMVEFMLQASSVTDTSMTPPADMEHKLELAKQAYRFIDQLEKYRKSPDYKDLITSDFTELLLDQPHYVKKLLDLVDNHDSSPIEKALGFSHVYAAPGDAETILSLVLHNVFKSEQGDQVLNLLAQDGYLNPIILELAHNFRHLKITEKPNPKTLNAAYTAYRLQPDIITRAATLCYLPSDNHPLDIPASAEIYSISALYKAHDEYMQAIYSPNGDTDNHRPKLLQDLLHEIDQAVQISISDIQPTYINQIKQFLKVIQAKTSAFDVEGGKEIRADLATALSTNFDLINQLSLDLETSGLPNLIEDILISGKTSLITSLSKSPDRKNDLDYWVNGRLAYPTEKLDQLAIFKAAYERLTHNNFFTQEDLPALQKVYLLLPRLKQPKKAQVIIDAFTQIGTVYPEHAQTIINFFTDAVQNGTNGSLLDKLILVDVAISTILNLARNHNHRHQARTALVLIYNQVEQQVEDRGEPGHHYFSRSYPRFMLKRKLEQALELLSSDPEDTASQSALGLLIVAQLGVADHTTTPGVAKRISGIFDAL